MMTGIEHQWYGLGVSEIGSFHQKLGIPNQDAFYLKFEGIPAVVAVSDGLGSKALSHLGSQAVGRAVKRLSNCKTYLLEAQPEEILKKFHSFWLDELKEEDIELCRATALFALVFEEKIFIAQLGDGDICLITSNQTRQQVYFLTQKDDELFSNQTDALGSYFEFNKWRYCFRSTSNLVACFMVTDGISDDLKNSSRKDFYLDLFNRYQDLAREQAQEDIQFWLNNWPVKGHSDDKTIAGLFIKRRE